MDMSPRSNGRFLISLAVLVVVAVLVWQTMEPGKYQQVTWLLLAFFAFRIVLIRLRSRYSSDGVIAQVDFATSDTADKRELLKSRKKTLKF
jgi:hypothetical protein